MRTALFTTLYPEALKYLPQWANSVKAQTDRNFDLWIGLTRMSVPGDQGALSGFPVHWVDSGLEASLVEVVNLAFQRMVQEYEIIILVDSDDVLMPNRIKLSKQALNSHEAYGCSLELVDENLDLLGHQIDLSQYELSDEYFLHYNCLGFSNTAYQTTLLNKIMPLPRDCLLCDWYVATKAWFEKASFHLDKDCHMYYRQHGNNMASLLPPFRARQILCLADRVRKHYELMEKEAFSLGIIQKYKSLLAKVSSFLELMSDSPSLLNQYTMALNELPPSPYWWGAVLHPELETLWKK